jgi:adhesin transport system outer membrane protein
MLPATIEEAQQKAIEAHPTLKSAMADVEARKAQDEVAKSPYYPIVDIEVDRNWKEDVGDHEYWEDELLAMVRVRFNLFRGWKDVARKAETTELLSEARQIRNNTHRQVVESIRLSWMAHKAVQDKIGHLENYINSTSATAEAYNKQWSLGKRTMLDVLDTEAEVINAKKDYVAAEYDGLYAQYRILSGMGTMVPGLGLTLSDDQPETQPEEKPAA